MDLETQNLVIPLLEDIAADAYNAQSHITDPDHLRDYLSRITEAIEEIKQRIPPETDLARAKRLMPGWPDRPCPTDYTEDFPDEIDENS